MKNESRKSTEKKSGSRFFIEGKIKREKGECKSDELPLVAYAFDKAGDLIGSAEINDKGDYTVAVKLARATDVELVVGPEGDAQQIRKSSAFSKTLLTQQWEQKEDFFFLRFDALLPLDVWRRWRPKRICISGHIRKHIDKDGQHELCALPYVKVEVFDVDRDFCIWPWLRLNPDILDKLVVRLPDLLKDPRLPLPIPLPDPLPDPAPDFKQFKPVKKSDVIQSPSIQTAESISQPALFSGAFKRSGETAQLNPDIAQRLDKLTLTSRKAPWRIFPRCFYSKQLICEASTDCKGYFKCCFNWWPFYFRFGRLRYDARPDIVIRVTQVINGVSTVIYMDPYTSTRWNVNNAHIDLYLDDEDIECGNSNCYVPPEGSPVFFTRIGDDEVYQINQSTGFYNDTTYSNVAYGSLMNIYGQFGDDLTRSDPAAGGSTPYFYYRLSYARQDSSDDDFVFIDRGLSDTRVAKSTLDAETHKLGPYTVNSEASLYEMRNFNDYYWYNPDWIGQWRSWLAEEDTGTYILRMEAFDKDGNKLNSASGSVDYRNGAGTGDGTPPEPLPAMTDHSDLLITLDNKRPVAELEVQGVTNACGVIPWSSSLTLNLNVDVSQENNRLRGWKLWYTKGVGSEVALTPWNISTNGLPGSQNVVVNGTPILAGLETTCAFALRLRAVAHVRNGRHFVFYDEDIDAIAIEKCSA
ncbi:MAG TPA: hypothetical protein ENJ08_16435 [Gammaproteobacteria bacterium]|nr:hypothetical protein [Gammaproteobacteria bacterium]